MSVADELDTLRTNISNAYDAVEEKGGTVPENKNTANLADAISSVSGGGGGITGLEVYEYAGTTQSFLIGDEYPLRTNITVGDYGKFYHCGDTGAISWSSSDTSICGITYQTLDDGEKIAKVVPVLDGAATITATLDDLSSSFTVNSVGSIWIVLQANVQAGTAESRYPVGTLIDEDAGAVVAEEDEVASHRTWRIVHYGDVTKEDGTVVPGVYLETVRVLANAMAYSSYTSYNQWTTSNTLRPYLNGTFLTSLSADLQAVLQPMQIEVYPRSGSLTHTTDTIFVASANEVMGVGSGEAYAEGPQWDYYKALILTATNSADASRIAYDPSGTARDRWLRSAYRSDTSRAWIVNTSGALDYGNVTNSRYARPACIIC